MVSHVEVWAQRDLLGSTGVVLGSLFTSYAMLSLVPGHSPILLGIWQFNSILTPYGFVESCPPGRFSSLNLRILQ